MHPSSDGAPDLDQEEIEQGTLGSLGQRRAASSRIGQVAQQRARQFVGIQRTRITPALIERLAKRFTRQLIGRQVVFSTEIRFATIQVRRDRHLPVLQQQQEDRE